MLDERTSPWRPLAREDIQSLIQFFDPAKNSVLNELQTDGCHRLWNTLCYDSLRFAYLADEVGMGKTYQALGVVGLLHYLKPDAKIIILCPGHEMQKQWSSDWHSFFKDKFCPNGIDGELKSLRIEANGIEGFVSSVQPLLCENLNQFGANLIASLHSVYLLRYSSFSLPIRVFDWDSFREDRNARVSITKLEADFRRCMSSLAFPVSEELLELASPDRKEYLSLDDASQRFLDVYAKCMANLISAFSPDLVIWDEAQYLRTDATRNGSMRTIFGTLHQAGSRHLFLSATPAHRDIRDIEQLDHLMLDENGERKRLIHIHRGDGQADSFRQSVSQWMVRRERSFAGMGKLEYRNFQEEPVELFAQGQSALYALTFAVMQKNLVKLLDGQNNRFRMGELSCHESSRASIEKSMPSKPGFTEKRQNDESVLEESAKRNQAEPIDEMHLRVLGERFKRLQMLSDRDIARDLPHAKVDHVVRELSRTCLENGTPTKELVFVRRVATVDELADGLLREFQRILDRRIEAFGEQPEIYWGLAVESDDAAVAENEVAESAHEAEDDSEYLGAVNELPYFKALSAVKGNLGRLTQYRNSLLNVDTSTIRFLLVARQEMNVADKAFWSRFLGALGVSEDSELYKPFKEDSNREFLLRRCMAHSIRFTDILVDLDILRRKDKRHYVNNWLDMLENPSKELSTYFANTRAKLLSWIEHFDTIVNKCFKGSGPHNSYIDIANNVLKYFRGLSPVARRSGRRKNENAVIQFKFPVFPNVLVCTDVLREGVNLHLFCDRISHYGLAWNSGDTEQRIGRVERADSLFERRILKDNNYKLHVGFPFLAGTLDERQVKKAIRRKREIDSLFAIVPPKETGEYDDSKEVKVTATYVHQAFEPLLPNIKVSPVPNDHWSKSNLENKRKWSQALQQAHTLVGSMSDFDWQGFRYSCCRMLGELGVVVVEWEKFSGSKKCDPWNACDRQILGVFGKERKTQWKSVRTLYFPFGQRLTREIVELFWANAKAELSASQADEDHKGFEYCSRHRTHTKRHEVPHPSDQREIRGHISYRCRWGQGYAIASVVCTLNDEIFTRLAPDELASNINKSLPYGNATIVGDRLMLVIPQVVGVEWPKDINESIAIGMSHWADRHQWILTQGEDDECLHEFPVAGISEMNTGEALAVIRSMRSWCEELCKDIDAEFEAPLGWRYLSFNQVVRNGVISCASEIQSIPKVGKFQIAFSVVGLDGKPEEKKVIFYLSAKRANERVVQGDMIDSWKFLSTDEDYENWLGDNYSVLINGSYAHYAFNEHRDGHQIRRLRVVFSADVMEKSGGRSEWVSYLVKLVSQRLLNNIFQYNSIEEKMNNLFHE